MSKEREYNRILSSILKLKKDCQVNPTKNWILLYSEHYKDVLGALELTQILEEKKIYFINFKK